MRIAVAKIVFGVLFIFTLGAPALSHAAEPFEGIWAKTQKECLDEEGPNSRREPPQHGF